MSDCQDSKEKKTPENKNKEKVKQPKPQMNVDAENQTEKIGEKSSELGGQNVSRVPNATEAREEKTKAQIIAERKAKQEAQKAAKAKKQQEKQNKSTEDNIDKKQGKSTEESVEKKQIKSTNESVDIKSDEKLSESGNKSMSQRKNVTDGEEKSKAQIRAERRAKQEAQRAAKAQKQQEKESKAATNSNSSNVSLVQENNSSITVVCSEEKITAFDKLFGKSEVKKIIEKKNDNGKKSAMSTERKVLITENLVDKHMPTSLVPFIHPSIVSLAVRCRDHVILGSNARCLAFLEAVKHVIRDYRTPAEKEFSRGLELSLQYCVDYLGGYRPPSVSMLNALRHVKRQMTQLPATMSEIEAKKKLDDAIDTYIREQIEVADDAICEMGTRKICSGDNILVFGYSSIVHRILLKAHSEKISFRVTVVDSRPTNEGKNMLRRLVREGLRCSYILIPAVSFMMREVTKVFLGAHALLANGYVMSRVGSSQIALVARAHNIPVLVFCETYKFSERVQTDSFVLNDYAHPDELIKINSYDLDHPLQNWMEEEYLTPLVPLFDVTPPDLVTAVMTELGILPCTSVPVVLRIKPSDSGI